MSNFDKHVLAFFPTHICFGPLQKLQSIKKIINFWYTFGWKWWVISFCDYLGLTDAYSVERTDLDFKISVVLDMAKPSTWTCESWNKGQHDLYFTVKWFCLISWRLFDVYTSYFGSMNQYDPTFDLKINVSHCDLYSMVKWFCLISWRLFDVWTLLFGIMSQYDPKFDLKINIGHCDLFHGPVILRYILKTIWYMNIILWDYGSVWPDVWPKNKCRSIWPIFRGPVTLSYIAKTIWCMSVTFSDN